MSSGGLSPGEAYDVLWLVNQVRASAGVAPLVWDEDLAASAELRAAELTIQLSHFRPDGTPCSAVFPESDSWEHACAEYIAMGQRPAYEANQSWTNSPGHYRNMVNPDYKKLGVGCFVDQNGYRHWVEVFTSWRIGIRGVSRDSKRNLEKSLALRVRICIILSCAKAQYIFPGGAVVAQLTVNQRVVGSNPTRGARFDGAAT